MEHEERVTSLELFFDLVFVFAITQVTALLSDDPTLGGIGRGMLVLGALWWAWAAYAWLTNTVNPEEGLVRLAVFAATGAMVVVALAVPEAFDEHGVLFGAAYLIVRTLHIALYALAARGDRDLARAVLSITPTSTISGALIVTAGFMDGGDRVALWVVALAIDYFGPLFGRGAGWHLHPRHFAERHGLIVIIAIGESIVALGVGAAGRPLGAGIVTAALLGIAVAAAFWWTYFDWWTIVAEQRLAESSGAAQAVLARDLYSYLHLPLVAGIVLFAMAMKKTLADVDATLDAAPAAALCGGLALYFLTYTALRFRVHAGLARGRTAAAIALLLLYPVAREVSALGALAAATGILVALIAYEAIHYREARARLRGAGAPA
jgi:low temperature requirement protein LtrA